MVCCGVVNKCVVCVVMVKEWIPLFTTELISKTDQLLNLLLKYNEIKVKSCCSFEKEKGLKEHLTTNKMNVI